MSFFRKILSGEILDSNFLKANLKFLLFLVGMTFLYIVFGSIGIYQRANIDQRRIRIEDLKEKSLLYSSSLMKISLQSQVYEEIKKRGLDLVPLTEPPKRIIIYTENIVDNTKDKNK